MVAPPASVSSKIAAALLPKVEMEPVLVTVTASVPVSVIPVVCASLMV